MTHRMFYRFAASVPMEIFQKHWGEFLPVFAEVAAGDADHNGVLGMIAEKWADILARCYDIKDNYEVKATDLILTHDLHVATLLRLHGFVVTDQFAGFKNAS